MWRGIHLLMESDAGCSGINPSSRIIIQNHQTSHPSRWPMYGAHWDNVVCSLISGTTLTIQQGSETLFVHGQVKTPHNSAREQDHICTRTSENVQHQSAGGLRLTQDVLGKPILKGQELVLGMKTWSTDVHLKYSMLHLEFVHWDVQRPSLDRSLKLSMQQAQMGIQTSISPGAHLLTQLVDHVKMVWVQGAMLGQRKCCSHVAKFSWLDAQKDWQVVCLHRMQASSDNTQGIIQNTVNEMDGCTATPNWCAVLSCSVNQG